MQGRYFRFQFAERLLSKSVGQGLLLLGLAGTIGISGVALQNTPLWRSTQAQEQPVSPVTRIQTVTALGRLEPQGEVIQLAPTAAGSRIAELRVQQGDRVKSGQVIAVLDSRSRLQAALAQSNRQVQVAETRLAQVKAGAKLGEINAQQAAIERTAAQLREDVQARTATVARLAAELQNAQTEFQRYESLYQTGAVSASLRDSKQLVLDAATQQLKEAQANRDQAAATLSAQLTEAQATLDQIAEVRPVDVAAALAEVNSAKAAVEQAQAELDLAYVKAPRDGQILQIYTWAGEVVGENGVVSLGQTNQMNVVAEVYETDVQRLQLGQSATITSAAFEGTASGTVQRIGLQVLKNGIRDTNPTADADARVVEVDIVLNAPSSRKLASLTNLEVTVEIPIASLIASPIPPSTSLP